MSKPDVTSPGPTSAPSAGAVLLALADRCEREEPSRDLDAAIMFACFAEPVGERGYLWPSDNPSWSFGIRFPGKDRAWFEAQRVGQETLIVWHGGDPILMNATRVKPVTTSLDAAVTLVPEGASWSVTVQGACEAEVTIPTGRFLIEGDIERYGHSGVPAKALCAAALRSRAALVQS